MVLDIQLKHIQNCNFHSLEVVGNQTRSGQVLGRDVMTKPKIGAFG